MAKLTADDVKRATPGYYGDGDGLWLRVGPTGAKSWVFRYRVNRKTREMGLGPVRLVPLYEARAKAKQHASALLTSRQGDAPLYDPIERRKTEKAARRLEEAKLMTFRECAEQYIAAHRAGWRSIKSLQAWENTLAADVYPVFGDLPVQSIDTALVMKVLDPIWTTKPETASRVRGRIESVLDWATARKHRQGDNPARWRGHLETQLPKTTKVRRIENFAALPYRELPDFITALRQQNSLAAPALEFAILTVARTAEVLGARWSEINLAERVWIVPASRMKGGKEHRVPLSDAAMALLQPMGQRQPHSQDWVFPGEWPGRPLGNTALLDTLRRMGFSVTVHGFRSAFSDWCTEQTQFATEVREMALAHSVGSAVERAYRRTDLFDQRVKLADAWARFVTGGGTGGEVVPLRRQGQ